jgi:SWI/SNF-related matrix-associated actin-dependent regulator 1 of chromatin subfamily A
MITTNKPLQQLQINPNNNNNNLKTIPNEIITFQLKLNLTYIHIKNETWPEQKQKNNKKKQIEQIRYPFIQIQCSDSDNDLNYNSKNIFNKISGMTCINNFFREHIQIKRPIIYKKILDDNEIFGFDLDEYTRIWKTYITRPVDITKYVTTNKIARGIIYQFTYEPLPNFILPVIQQLLENQRYSNAIDLKNYYDNNHSNEDSKDKNKDTDKEKDNNHKLIEYQKNANIVEKLCQDYKNRKTYCEKLVGIEDWNRLLPFQQDCVTFVYHTCKGRALIADHMGVGKSIEGLMTSMCYRQRWPVLLVCHSSLAGNWFKEIQKHFSEKIKSDLSRFLIIKNGKELKSLAEELKKIPTKSETKLFLQSKYNMIICSYNLVTDNIEAIRSFGFEIMMVDESQAVKNHDSKRSVAIVNLAKQIPSVIFLSGTPMEKTRMMWPVINALKPHLFNNDFFLFAERYCDPKKKEIFVGGVRKIVTTYDGLTYARELNLLLTSLMMIRRKSPFKLPKKHRIRFMLNPNMKQTTIVEKAMAKVDMKTMLLDENMKQDYGKNNAFMDAYRKIGRIVKPPLVQEFVRMLVQDTRMVYQLQNFDKMVQTNNNIVSPEEKEKDKETEIDNKQQQQQQQLELGQEKILIFAHHKIMIAAIKDILIKLNVGFIEIIGSKTKKSKVQELVDNFQTDDNYRVALLSMTSAGVGLTLTAGTIVVFAEMHPVAETILQSECRAHRYGQEKEVRCIYLILPKSIEELIWQIVNKKYKNLSMVIDGELDYFCAKKIEGNSTNTAIESEGEGEDNNNDDDNDDD